MTNVDLAIGGMTCASCAARIEKKLNGSTASPRRSTTRPRRPASTFPGDGHRRTTSIAAVEQTGYTAALPAPTATTGRTDADETARRAPAVLRRRLLVSAALAVAGGAAGDGPGAAVRLTGSGSSLALAAPVVVWGGWPFHRAALVNLRHGAATMDTLVSLGTLAAFGWSLYALFFGDAGMPGMRSRSS